MNDALNIGSNAAATAESVEQPATTSATRDVLAEILEWSKDRLAWQRDALRLLFTRGNLQSADLDNLTELCKSAHGLAPVQSYEPLKLEHIAVRSKTTAAVSLLGVTHHRGVNALAQDQTVAFGPNLTVVYGQNAAGKSGYARILKKACRSRGVEEILGNVLVKDAPPLKPLATIRYRQGSAEVPLEWTPEARPSEALANVSVFDSQSAAVYLKDKTDVAFRPFGLDIFDHLSTACTEVRSRLEKEEQQLKRTAPDLPTLAEGTRGKALIDSLTGLTNVDEVRALSILSDDEKHSLKELHEQQRDVQSSNPMQRSRELKLKADRMNLLSQHLESLESAFGDKGIAKVQKAADDLQAARQTLATIQRTAFPPNLLLGTGEDTWRRMWDAAADFSAVAYSGERFPVIKTGARCPFCQQSIAPDAANRLTHFAEYVESAAQQDLRRAETAYSNVLAELRRVVVDRTDIKLAIEEISSDDRKLSERVTQYLGESARLKAVFSASTVNFPIAIGKLGKSPSTELRAIITNLESRARQLQSQQVGFDPKLLKELQELESRAALGQKLEGVLDEIERKKRLAAYRQCVEDTTTTAITRKSTELTKELVTDSLRNTLQNELLKLEFNHLAVEIQPAGATKGALFHQLAFANAPGVAVGDVVSEGESRTLSLAAFLTELSTSSSKSGIIFDDPVSSLDHVWRERIARRLVAEAKIRQVIVFTHDLVFLRVLLDESEKQHVLCENQYVRRDGQVGICSADLPWLAMPVKERIGKLRVRWQEAEKANRVSGPEVYEPLGRDIFAHLREAWEQAVAEVLLNDIVERYRPSIETQRLRKLSDITEIDCQTVENAMTECSRWMRGHDHAAAEATPFPAPAEVEKRIDELEAWVKAIRKRRA